MDGSTDSAMALNALMWISNATRPLHIGELRVALAFKEGISIQDAYDAEDVENPCVGLVIVDRKSNFCRLAHQTVQEYLITKPDWTKNANFLIAETTLKYITGFKVDCFQEESSLKIHLEMNILYEYAVKNWGVHMKGCDEEQNLTLIPILDALFKTNKKAMEPAMQVHGWVPGRLIEATESHFRPLQTAAFWGLSLFAQAILPGNKYLNSNDWMYCRAPLSYAAERGHEAVVKLLLATKGIDINTKCKYGRTPLSYAAEWGREAVVKLLIEAQADVNIKSDDGRTPLLWAAINGRRLNVELLVELDKVDLNIDTTLWSKTSPPDPEIMQIIQAAKEKRCSSSQVPIPEPMRNESLTETTVESPPTLPSQQSPASLSILYLSSFGGRNIFLAFWVISCFSILCYFLL